MKACRVEGVLVRGYGVASGQGRDPRYPAGTLALQQPHFAARGLDLRPYHPGTLNLSIEPYRFEPVHPRHTFRQVSWSPYIPPEDFSFFDCQIIPPGGQPLAALVYYPHPETKPEHLQDSSIVEVLAPFIPGLRYGDCLTLELACEQVGRTG